MIDRDRRQEDGEHHDIERPVVGGIEQTEDDGPRHVLQAVLAAGERRLQAEEINHLRQGQRDHREIDALPADRDRSRDQAQRRAGRTAAGSAASNNQPTP